MKLRIGIVAGGMSSEHEISCTSAGGILGAIDRERFEPVLVGLTKAGEWVLPASDQVLEIVDGILPEISSGRGLSFEEILDSQAIDIIFPVLHGPFGEDGAFQGLCEIAGIRYVGSSVLASAVAMDKSFAKPIFSAHGLKVADGITLHRREWNGAISTSALQYPLFVKPARGGSSRGTSKVKRAEDLSAAIDFAFEFDSKVLIEQAVIGREIECAVLMVDGVAKASPLGEITLAPEFEFYDFNAKYLGGSSLELPSDLPSDEIRSRAIEAFSALGCEGLARVDFFYSDAGEIIINEINTLPGFTSTSAYPKLWAQAGMSYTDLISALIDAALYQIG